MPDIQKTTKVEYGIEFYSDELIRLAAGKRSVMMVI